MAFLDRIATCNAHDLSGFRPFEVADRRVGWVRHAFAERLASAPDVFEVTDDTVRLAPGLTTPEARTRAVDGVLRDLADAGIIRGWRDEPYPVASRWGETPLMTVERAAAPWLGLRAWGVHVNGFVREGGNVAMWVARRARGKQTWPGMLDNMVAGGQPAHVGLMENVVKECAEEAAIGAELASAARPVGTISYVMEIEEGLKPDVMFCYDLELPPGFAPRPTDGEVESFTLMPIDEVAAIVRDTAEFKFNCNLVVIDFLLRHGLLDPDREPDYHAICRGLRQGEAESV